MPSIAVITPTVGRSSLQATIDSVLPQLSAADEWWVIGDGPQLSVRSHVRTLNHPSVLYFEHRDPRSRYGNAQRNAAMLRSQADYFVFLDDDDTLLPGALDAVRREGISSQPLMFKMDHRPLGTILWRDQDLRVGNVGGAMFVVPNLPGKWALWPDVAESCISDFHFIQQTLALWPPGSLRWCEDVIYCCPQQSGGRTSTAPSLPYSFAEWRLQRDGLSYSEHVAFYDAIYDLYPNQHYCDLTEARRFAEQLPKGSRILELGGWKGEVAAELLKTCPRIVHWHNIELSTKAVRAGLIHPRYTADVGDDFIWNSSDLPAANVLFAAYVLEHLKAEEIGVLLKHLPQVTEVYVESPLPPEGTGLTWYGSQSTNILEIGWQELELLFHRFGFEVVRRQNHVRHFRRLLSPQVHGRSDRGESIAVEVSGPGAEKPSDSTHPGQFSRSPASLRPSQLDRDCLIILQAREIPHAVASLQRLPIDKLWFRGFTEEGLAPHLNQFIADTSYRNYLLCADDVIVSPKAFACVTALLQEHPAATGYCRLAADSPLVNVTRRPLELRNGQYAEWADYDFYNLTEVQALPGEFVSWLGGWALTGMRRDLWLKYPFRVNSHTKQQTDFETSWRMGQNGEYFYSHRDAYIEHLKQSTERVYQENWLVGKIQPEMSFNVADSTITAPTQIADQVADIPPWP